MVPLKPLVIPPEVGSLVEFFLFSNLVPIKFYHYQGGCTIEKITRRLK